MRKWRDCYAAAGAVGLQDRTSRTLRNPRLLDDAVEDEIAAVPGARLSGPAIAHRLFRPVSTVCLVLRRRGLSSLRALEPRPPLVAMNASVRMN